MSIPAPPTKDAPLPVNTPAIIKEQAALILFDIVDYSKLTDEHQFHTVLLLSDAMRRHLDFLACQSFVSAEQVLLGMIPTGDGFYVLVRERFAKFGVLLALSLRTQVLVLRERSQELFAGVRTAVHVGTVIPVHDPSGSTNFVGSGLNDCARLCAYRPADAQLREVGCDDGNWLIASAPALDCFDAVFSFPDALRYRSDIGFVAGSPFTFSDKHQVEHAGCLIEAKRFLGESLPALPDLSALFA